MLASRLSTSALLHFAIFIAVAGSCFAFQGLGLHSFAAQRRSLGKGVSCTKDLPLSQVSLNKKYPVLVSMGLRDQLKHHGQRFCAIIGLAVGVLSAPKSASAAGSAYVDANTPTIVLPSQISDGTYENPVVRIVKDKRLWAGVGACTVGAGAYVLYQKVEKDKSEQLRSSLTGLTGLQVDASILDEARINRPGAKTYEYTAAPQFGTYRPPSGKMMKDVRDKYVFSKTGAEPILDKVELDIFKDNKDGKEGDKEHKAQVELVDNSDGPKSAAQKSVEAELKGLSMEEIMSKAGADPTATMDPAYIKAALPELQRELSEVLKEGVSDEEIKQVKASFADMGVDLVVLEVLKEGVSDGEIKKVKASFADMGVDLVDMFKRVEDLERAGLADGLGAEGREFFSTLRKILKE